MTSHVIAYRSLELLFGMHAFHLNCFFEDFNCVFTQIRCLSRVLFVKSLKKDSFGITSLRENGILKIDTKEKADICNRQFQSAFTREADSDPPSKGASPFSSMGEITVDPKGVAKLLDGLNVC